MANNLSQNALLKFTKASEIGPSIEGLIAEFLEFSTAIIKSFVSSS